MSSATWLRVNRAKPCPVCGKDHACKVTADDALAIENDGGKRTSCLDGRQYDTGRAQGKRNPVGRLASRGLVTTWRNL
jgi:hypothetical protein